MTHLKPGEYFTGPEPYGCFNSGVAPVLARSKLLKKDGKPEYFVCRSGDVDDIPKYVVYGKRNMFGCAPGNFQLFKTLAPAKKAFEARVKQILDSNAESHKRVQELKAKVATSDNLNDQITAALQIADITG